MGVGRHPSVPESSLEVVCAALVVVRVVRGVVVVIEGTGGPLVGDPSHIQ